MFIIFSYNHLYFYECYFSPFISDVIFQSSLFFSQRFVNSLFLFKEPILSYTDLFYFIFSLNFIYYCYDLYFSYLLQTLGFVWASFSSFFRCKVVSVCVCVCVQPYVTPWSPMDCSPSGSSVHGIFQARRLELPFPTLGIFLTSGIKSLASPALQVDSLPVKLPGKSYINLVTLNKDFQIIWEVSSDDGNLSFEQFLFVSIFD